MKEIIVKNQEIKDILNETLWYYDNRDELATYRTDSFNVKGDEFLTDEYLKSIVDMGDKHNGYPVHLRGHNLSSYYDYGNQSEYIPKSYVDRYRDINNRLMQTLSVRNNAVASIYPPEGFISWHNNANATGFNLIFTWSETGDGWLDYVDENNKRVRMQDKKGEWVCRYGMFGKYHQDKYPILYHAASTNCWRITLAFIFSADEASSGLQEFIIEELETP